MLQHVTTTQTLQQMTVLVYKTLDVVVVNQQQLKDLTVMVTVQMEEQLLHVTAELGKVRFHGLSLMLMVTKLLLEVLHLVDVFQE